MKILAAALVVVILPVSASAHHSVRAFYDDENTSEIEGTITNLRWANPHIRFSVERLGENGEPEIWEIESGAVNFLERDGVGRGDLAVGNRVKVVGYASRFGRDEMVASYITLPSGEDVVLWGGLFGGGTTAGLTTRSRDQAATGAQAAAREARGMFRVWSVGRDSAGRRGNEEALPLTAAALAARGDYDPLTDDTALRCIPQGMPGIMDNPFPMELLERGGDIVLRTEEWDVVRTIHMDGAGNAENEPATPHGYSVGRWEEGTLVVATTKIDWPYFDDIGTPMSPAMEIVERFTLSEDERRLDMTMTVTDPATFTDPVHLTGAYWTWVPGEEVKPYNCTL